MELNSRKTTLERLPQVKARVGLSRSEIYRRASANPPTFPKPVKLGLRASAWNSTAIDQWIADRIAGRAANDCGTSSLSEG